MTDKTMFVFWSGEKGMLMPRAFDTKDVAYEKARDLFMYCGIPTGPIVELSVPVPNSGDKNDE